MNKRQREATLRKFKRLEAQIGTKRDELRKLTADYRDLVESVDEADEAMMIALQHLKDSREQFEYAIDTLSRYA